MIDQRLIEQLHTIGQSRNEINKIILFGSRAIGDNTERSDIDLAVVAPNMSNKDWIEFTFELEDTLETLLSLDLIRFEDASDELKNEIIKYGQELYSSTSSFKRKTP
ncbi:nucleotidyltransferase domain-containing protein [Virgibacillus dakarensis]|uniref:type VII toxin-antitoxin system MntA family adenylyltransferase antitoxin n=1 Tax=Virgibacillus dakarensis TaxID=1917889 RepID=UPI000B436382|nr:nucleotidyltransferase domain-containing protein [Virgibacillus dakarensis]MTW84594.1 nucleotidyltransferase domain-containing protein [Virgibacillus dakarensis]